MVTRVTPYLGGTGQNNTNKINVHHTLQRVSIGSDILGNANLVVYGNSYANVSEGAATRFANATIFNTANASVNIFSSAANARFDMGAAAATFSQILYSGVNASNIRFVAGGGMNNAFVEINEFTFMNNAYVRGNLFVSGNTTVSNITQLNEVANTQTANAYYLTKAASDIAMSNGWTFVGTNVAHFAYGSKRVEYGIENNTWVQGNVVVGGALFIGAGGAASYGPGAIYTDGNYGMILRGRNVGTAAGAEFTLANSVDVHRFKIDIGGNVTVGPTHGAAKFNVTGNAFVSGDLSVNGLTALTAADGVTTALMRGATKAARFIPIASGFTIEGVDNTGLASYQPLTIGGSLIQFTIGGAEVARINSTGLTVPQGGTTTPSFTWSGTSLGMFASTGSIYFTSGGVRSHRFYSGGSVTLTSGGGLVWSSTSDADGTGDLALSRDAANTLALRNGGTNLSPVPQTFRVYNYYNNASDYERVRIGYASNVFKIIGEVAGSGTSRPLLIQSDGITTIGIEDSTNNPGGASVGVYRNGTSGVTQFAVGGTSLTSTAQLHTRLMPTINQTVAPAAGTYTVLDINPTETSIGAGPHYLIRGRIAAGANVFGVTNGGAIAGASLALGGATIGSYALAVTGTALFTGNVDSTGYTNTSTSFQAAAAGQIYFSGRSSIQSSVNGKILLGSNTPSLAADFHLQFQGTTSAGAEIKVAGNTSTVKFRLADDSADAPITASAATFSGALSVDGAISTDSNFNLGASRVVGWGNGSIGTIDTGLSRIGAGIIGVGTGAAGNIAGGLQAATLALGGAVITSEALAVTGTSALGLLGVAGAGTAADRALVVGMAALTGTTIYGAVSSSNIPATVTAGATVYYSGPSTAASAFTLSSLRHFSASSPATFGAGSTVTNQYGFIAESVLTGATNNYGFYGNIPSGTNRWNLYMAGTAANYLGGTLAVGGAAIGTNALAVNGNAYISNGALFFNSGSRIDDSGVATLRLMNNSASNIVSLTIAGAAATPNLQFGAPSAAVAVAQTLSVQSVVAGTTNTLGANWTFAGSQGTGTGAGGSIIFQTAPAGSTGSAVNALANSFEHAYSVSTIYGTLNLRNRSDGADSLTMRTADGTLRGTIYVAPSYFYVQTNNLPLYLYTGTNGNVWLGADGAATAQNQILNVQNIYAGNADTAGGSLTIKGSRGTGTGAGGSIIFQTAPAGSTGSAVNALTTALTITSTGALQAAASLAIGGATISTHALAVTGTVQVGSIFNVSNAGNVVASQLYALTNVVVGSDTGQLRFGTSLDAFITRRAAANLNLGAPDAALPQAQTLSVQSVASGTANTLGANWTFAGSQGTGTGAGGSIIFQTAPAGSTGSAQNALTTALTIAPANSINSLLSINSGSSTGALISIGDNSFRTLQFQGTGFGSNGVMAIRNDQTIAIRGGGAFGWESGANNPATGTIDTNLSRISAGIVGVGTGVIGSITGGLQAANLAVGGATIGTDALAVTGTSTFSSTVYGAAEVRALVAFRTSGYLRAWNYHSYLELEPLGVNGQARWTADGSHVVGVLFDYATDATLKILTRAGVNTAAVQAGSLALGGATIGSNALAVSGTSSLDGVTTIGGGGNSTPQLIFTPNSGLSIKLGMANSGSALIAFSSSNTPLLAISDSGRVVFSSNSGGVSFTNASNNPTTTVDVNLSRIAAGIIGVGTGAAGNIAGGLQAATLALGGATIGSNALAVTGNTNVSGTITAGGEILSTSGLSGGYVTVGSTGFYTSGGTYSFRNSTQNAGGVMNVNTDGNFIFYDRTGVARANLVANYATLFGDVVISGNLTATSKSFLIEHPTIPGMQLQYGSLEGPEHGVYHRGKLRGNNFISLPHYWSDLVDTNSMTVNLTSVGTYQQLWANVQSNCITVNNGEPVWCDYLIHAERKDIAKLEVEI